MLVNLQGFRHKKEQQQLYRDHLIQEIVAFYRATSEVEKPNDFYFEHVRTQFSTSMLEDLLHRLQNRVRSSH